MLKGGLERTVGHMESGEHSDSLVGMEEKRAKQFQTLPNLFCHTVGDRSLLDGVQVRVKEGEVTGLAQEVAIPILVNSLRWRGR